MKNYKIPIYWTVSATVEVCAENLEKAIQEADKMPLPIGEYLEGSFAIDAQMISELNEGDRAIVAEAKQFYADFLENI